MTIPIEYNISALEDIYPGRFGVAVCGTRTPTPEGIAFIKECIHVFTANNMAYVTSGITGVEKIALEYCVASSVTGVLIAPCGEKHCQPLERFFNKLIAKKVHSTVQKGTLTHRCAKSLVEGRNAMYFPHDDDVCLSAGSVEQSNDVLLDSTDVFICIEPRIRGCTLDAGKRALKRGILTIVFGEDEGASLLIEAGGHFCSDSNLFVSIFEESFYANTDR
jgi:hypothetical protein